MYKDQENGEDVTHLSKVEARAGSKTSVTRNILVASLLLVVIVLLIALGMGFFEAHQSGADGVNVDNSAQTTATQ